MKDIRGDIYSLGAVVFFALTGRPPFQARTTGQLLAAHQNQPPPLVTQFCLDVPEYLSTVVIRCLSKSPADRFQSVNEVVQFLEMHS